MKRITFKKMIEDNVAIDIRAYRCDMISSIEYSKSNDVNDEAFNLCIYSPTGLILQVINLRKLSIKDYEKILEYIFSDGKSYLTQMVVYIENGNLRIG